MTINLSNFENTNKDLFDIVSLQRGGDGGVAEQYQAKADIK